jgi:hypothetical protein
VRFDEDAPIGTFTSTQHARRAVLFVQRNDTTGTRRNFLTLVRIARGLRTVLEGLHHLAERDAKTLNESGNLWLRGHQSTTLNTAVTTIFKRANGMRTFQARLWS